MFDQTAQELQTLFVPANAKGQWHEPKTMLVFHGQGDCKESYLPLIKEINLTGLNALLIDAPYKALLAPGMMGHFWYHPEPVHQPQTLKHSLTMVKSLLANYSSKDIILLGFSAGARIVLNLINGSQNYAAAVALSPRFQLLDPVHSHIQTPCFVAHGKFDQVIPFEETQKATKLWFDNHPGQFKSYDCAHEITIEEIQDVREWLSAYFSFLKPIKKLG